jgi:CrcB protein
VTVNVIGAMVIGSVSALLFSKTNLSAEYSSIISFVVIGVFMTLSSLYLVLYFIEQGHTFDTHFRPMMLALLSNVIFCGFALWTSMLLAKQI